MPDCKVQSGAQLSSRSPYVCSALFPPQPAGLISNEKDRSAEDAVPCVAFRTRTLSDRGNERTGGMFFLLLSCEKLFGALVRVESPATFSGVTRKREGALSYAALELCARGLIFRSVAIALGLQHELFRRTHWEHIDYSHLSEI